MRGPKKRPPYSVSLITGAPKRAPNFGDTPRSRSWTSPALQQKLEAQAGFPGRPPQRTSTGSAPPSSGEGSCGSMPTLSSDVWKIAISNTSNIPQNEMGLGLFLAGSGSGGVGIYSGGSLGGSTSGCHRLLPGLAVTPAQLICEILMIQSSKRVS